MSELSITPLTSGIGARVTGLDLSCDVPQETVEELRQALWNYSVLVLPQQNASSEEQSRFAHMFGTPAAQMSLAEAGMADPVSIVDPERIRYVTRGVAWHTDSSFSPAMPVCATLQASVVPPVGGDTCWSSTYLAYESLSETMKSWLGDATAVHAGGGMEAEGVLAALSGDELAGFLEGCGPRSHPMVVLHPYSGRKALFINPVFTKSVDGLTFSESNAVLTYLFDHMTRADLVYRHHWQVGDLVAWDEISTIHLPPNDFGLYDRQLTRVHVGQYVPAG